MILALQTADHTAHAWLLPTDHAALPADPSAIPATAQLHWDSGRALSEQLLPRLVAFLAEHHAPLTNLTGIVIFSGPGSFTSLRIGHTTANALADSLGIPIAGATGNDWLTTARAALADTPLARPALPHYGAEANITKPKS